MLRVGRPVTIGYDRLAPGTVSVRTLSSRSIGARVRIIRLADTPTSVRTVGRSTAGVCPSVRIVGSAGGGPSIRPVNPASGSVGAAVCIIVRTYAIGAWVRAIDGVSTNRITIVRWIVIAGAAGQDRANGGASDESSQISCGVARLDSSLGSSGLGNIGDVVNRRAGRNSIDLFGHRSCRRPGAGRIW